MLDTLLDFYIGLLPVMGWLLATCAVVWLTEEWEPGRRFWDKLTGRWIQ